MIFLNYWAIYHPSDGNPKKYLRRGEFLSAKHAWDCLRCWNTEDWTYIPARDDEHERTKFDSVGLQSP